MIVSEIVALAALWALQAPARPPAIVFVCEHGAAKSVIATAYFNTLAAERNLPYRATFRGTSPQDDLSVRAVAGLKADSLAVPPGKPAAIADSDIAEATHIFAIGCTLPDAARTEACAGRAGAGGRYSRRRLNGRFRRTLRLDARRSSRASASIR